MISKRFNISELLRSHGNGLSRKRYIVSLLGLASPIQIFSDTTPYISSHCNQDKSRFIIQILMNSANKNNGGRKKGRKKKKKEKDKRKDKEKINNGKERVGHKEY